MVICASEITVRYDVHIRHSSSIISRPVIKLGYATYEGYYNDTYDLNIWKGIRYAAPPVRKLRCPQSGAFGTPEVYGFNSNLGDEGCLYLNVYAVPDASDLPVLYWLGAFGFLSSKAVKKKGKLNAGLLDRVTIVGESSSAGSVMYYALAYGGKDSKLFTNISASSRPIPYTPPIYCYNETVPNGHYAAFAELAGCSEGSPGLQKHRNVFDCLIAANSAVLQNASGTVSMTRGYFGSFSWLPLLLGRVSGKHLLNNGNEGVPLTNPAVETQAQYDDFVNQAQPGDDDPRFDTLGDRGPTALNQSSYATGIQQAVFNIAGELTFDCLAQWFVKAYTTSSRKRNFVINNSPIISIADTTAGYKNATPEYSLINAQHMDLNTTSSVVTLVPITDELSFYVRSSAGIVNNFRLANSWTWEGGRGARCAFWCAVSAKVPY
ncbi:Alpha/Beta hydrolase protein [Dactylonectria macrodidyma]|uniref:Alpha/Beta hydrolase protein n=1 Tax=Dactylonectria macrodidyma TaxID=307937 RepID=A0A9P9FMA3_9HYPO|nr:Alpha/Beta hydrolase protein [Dactylonectria macrodidyma]